MSQSQNFIEDNLLILSKQTMDLFLSQPNPSDLIAIYTFYYYTAKWQKTNQVKASVGYVAKGLKIGEKKVRKVKQQLIDLGLVDEVKIIDKNTGQVTGWYIKLNYIWKTKNHPVKNAMVDKSSTTTLAKPTLAKSHRVENCHPNALSAVKLNALSVNNKCLEKEKEKEKEKTTDEDIRLTQLLMDRVKENFPFIRSEISQSDLTEMNRLHRLDGYDYQMIEAVILWATSDPFWKSNIRSVNKLRIQFENLLVRIKTQRDVSPRVMTI